MLGFFEGGAIEIAAFFRGRIEMVDKVELFL